MDICSIFLISILLFFIIYFAVRLAIKPLLYKPDIISADEHDFGLVLLRDIGILSNAELEEVIEMYQHKGGKRGDKEQYQKYVKVLNELKEKEYFTDEGYSNKINILKRYFNVD